MRSLLICLAMSLSVGACGDDGGSSKVDAGASDDAGAGGDASSGPDAGGETAFCSDLKARFEECEETWDAASESYYCDLLGANMSEAAREQFLGCSTSATCDQLVDGQTCLEDTIEHMRELKAHEDLIQACLQKDEACGWGDDFCPTISIFDEVWASSMEGCLEQECEAASTCIEELFFGG